MLLIITTLTNNSVTLPHKNSRWMQGGFIHFERVYQRIHNLNEREKCVCASPATLERVEAEETGICLLCQLPMR